MVGCARCSATTLLPRALRVAHPSDRHVLAKTTPNVDYEQYHGEGRNEGGDEERHQHDAIGMSSRMASIISRTRIEVRGRPMTSAIAL